MFSETQGEQKRKVQEKTGDIYQRLSMKLDRLSDVMDENSRLLKQVEAQMKENKKQAIVLFDTYMQILLLF